MASAVIAACMVLLTLGVWVALGFLIVAALQVMRTARCIESLAERARVEVLAHQALETLQQARGALAGVRQTAEAVEALAHEARETVSGARYAADRLGDFARGVRSGWLKALGVTLGAVSSLWGGSSRDDSRPTGAAAG